MDSFISALINTALTVVLTLLVTYLSTSITSSMKKQQLCAAMYSLMLNMLLNEYKMISLFLEKSENDKFTLHSSKISYNSSVFELLQLCEIDDEGQLQLLQICDRYNLTRQETLILSKDEAQKILSRLSKDSSFSKSELEKIKKRTWFYYWWQDFKNLFSFIPYIFSKLLPFNKRHKQECKNTKEK